MKKKFLIIGGTQEGNLLAKYLENHNINYVISYLGIVRKVNKKKFNKRIGGFGGESGIKQYIKSNNITHVIDCSHPFSETISRNTFEACNFLNIPIVKYTRKPWYKKKGDIWTKLKNFQECLDLLKCPPKRIFLSIGRKNLHIFKPASHHFFLLRFIENINTSFFPNQKYLISSGPHKVNEEKRILEKYKIESIITKNSGGSSYSKITAARELKIPVLIISRPKSIKMKIFYDFHRLTKWIFQDL